MASFIGFNEMWNAFSFHCVKTTSNYRSLVRVFHFWKLFTSTESYRWKEVQSSTDTQVNIPFSNFHTFLISFNQSNHLSVSYYSLSSMLSAKYPFISQFIIQLPPMPKSCGISLTEIMTIQDFKLFYYWYESCKNRAKFFRGLKPRHFLNSWDR